MKPLLRLLKPMAMVLIHEKDKLLLDSDKIQVLPGQIPRWKLKLLAMLLLLMKYRRDPKLSKKLIQHQKNLPDLGTQVANIVVKFVAKCTML